MCPHIAPSTDRPPPHAANCPRGHPSTARAFAPNVLVRALCVRAESQLAEFETPEDVAVTRICQHGVETKVYKKTTAKLSTGDAMTLKGHLHTLAALVVVKDSVLTLVPAKARNQSAHAKLLKERRGSIISAERLAVWVQRLVRFRIAERKRQREHHAILYVQAAWLLHRVAREGTDSTWSVSFLERAKLKERGLLKERTDSTDSTWSISFLKKAKLKERGLKERGTPASVLEETAGASCTSANEPAKGTASGWAVLRKHVKVGAAMKTELKRIRQKKRPSQAKKAKEAQAAAITCAVKKVPAGKEGASKEAKAGKASTPKDAKAAVPFPMTRTGPTNRFRQEPRGLDN